MARISPRAGLIKKNAIGVDFDDDENITKGSLAMSRFNDFDPMKKKGGNKRQDTMNLFTLVSFSFGHESSFFSGFPVRAVTGEVDGTTVVVCFERSGNDSNRKGQH